MELDEGTDSLAVSKIWGPLLTPAELANLGIPTDSKETDKSNKRHKPNKTEQKGKGKGKSHKSTSQETVTVNKAALVTLTKLVLRHEDSLNTTLQESQFLMFMSPGAGSVLKQLFEESCQWHESGREIPLRHVLAKSMLQHLEERLVKLIAADPNTELYKECVDHHLILPDDHRTTPFLRWDASKKCLVPNHTPGLPAQQVLKSFQAILRLMEDPAVTLRFHALKKTQDQQVIPWMWTVSQRTAPELWHSIHQLCYHASWRLILTRLRPQGLQRQPLAQTLQRLAL